ncbi:hypothetical protein K456DRAFT_1917445 [Colletotrichum gloeosporioides 23]|nr:hypothetical protein K456DRAFT_1917445 [Colletotrichum gloeosporioides 23]
MQLVGLGMLYITYNVLFHPLAHFPGPKYAACSDIPFMAIQTSGDMVPWLVSLHNTYGSVVRVGATRLSFIDGQAWKDIYSHSFQKTDFQLRKVFSPAFSERSLQAQSPLISKYVDQLIESISRDIKTNPQTMFDMVKLYNFTTFAIMAELAFGEPLGLLASSSYSEWVGNIFGNLKANAIAQIGREWPWLGNLVQIVAPHHLKKASELHFAHASERVDRRINTTKEDGDIWSLVLSQPDSRQITKGDMYTNSSLFMVAGSETIATILSGVTYLLLKNPNKLARLVTEIRQVESEKELAIQRLSKMAYLTAVLNEALRWYPPVPVGVWREVSEGGATVAGHWVPVRTRVSVPQFAANHSSHNFKDPKAFVPERWLPGPEFEPNTKDVVQAFSLGPWNCIGMNLAWHEMRYILARTLWHFNLFLCAESTNWTKQKTYILWEKLPLMLQFTRNAK